MVSQRNFRFPRRQRNADESVGHLHGSDLFAIDLRFPSGSIRDGVIYSFTSAMSPFEKESAFMHLPTYVAGIIFHIGTFLSFPVLLTLIIYPKAFIESALLSSLGGVVFSAGAISGLAILIKRIVKKELRSISGPEDKTTARSIEFSSSRTFPRQA